MCHMQLTNQALINPLNIASYTMSGKTQNPMQLFDFPVNKSHANLLSVSIIYTPALYLS